MPNWKYGFEGQTKGDMMALNVKLKINNDFERLTKDATLNAKRE